ncbi:hypothetical protein BKM77_14180 [Pseudomonas syringae]|nr:hypothetical protein A988_19341 [Pseudomonas syringae BRIP39023]KEZ26365.1 hypothetical protein A3SK_0116165 [Pseudomonas amygdali pv. tabaci str. 6605]POR58621.1 hypothetical protein BKM23_16380 [Pseudomonas syringae pv. syringae]RXF63748.1 hypothetical protein BKM77_14180 [Pseudomonas syringae]
MHPDDLAIIAFEDSIDLDYLGFLAFGELNHAGLVGMTIDLQILIEQILDCTRSPPLRQVGPRGRQYALGLS